MHSFFVCLCTHVLRGWCLQLRLTDEMTSPKSADGCLAPEVLLSSLFLFYIPAPLLRRPPSPPALIFLSEGLWQKREPDSWHGGRGGGGSRGILEVIYPATLHSERPQVVVQFALFLTSWQAACLPLQQLAALLMKLHCLKNSDSASYLPSHTHTYTHTHTHTHTQCEALLPIQYDLNPHSTQPCNYRQ